MREGRIDKRMIQRLQRNVVRNPELVLTSKRDFAAEYNRTKLEELRNEIVDYPSTVTKKPIGLKGQEVVKTSSNRLCVGAKAIITKNMSPFFNGQRVTVIDTQEKSVKIRTENNSEHLIEYTEDIDGDKKENYMPVEACYALTIHKS